MLDKPHPPFCALFFNKPRIIESTVPTEPSVYLVYLLYYELYWLSKNDKKMSLDLKSLLS
jgi:hypothetical protein